VVGLAAGWFRKRPVCREMKVGQPGEGEQRLAERARRKGKVLGEKENWLSVCEGGARLLLWWKGMVGMESEWRL